MYYNIMLALLPAVVMGVVYYGLDALRVIGASVASAMLAEYLMQKLLRRPVRIADGSAAVSVHEKNGLSEVADRVNLLRINVAF